MEVVLAGRFENAMLRGIGTQLNQHLPLHMSYYRSIYRFSPPAYFERCATFMAIADKVYLPQIDWAVETETNRQVTAEDFGIFYGKEEKEWDENIEIFVATLLKRRVFSERTYAALRNIEPRPDNRSPNPPHRLRVKGVGEVDTFAHHHLCRLLLQVQCSVGRFLIVGDDERAVLLGSGLITNKR
jgi:hypothetical protein